MHNVFSVPSQVSCSGRRYHERVQVSDHGGFLGLVLVTRVALHHLGIKLSQDFFPAGAFVSRYCTTSCNFDFLPPSLLH